MVRKENDIMTNEQLVIRIRAGEETAANMLQLWQQDKAFVSKLARRYAGYAEMDDLMQEGYLALCDAVAHYDADKGVPFINYAAFWIKQRLGRYAERSGAVYLASGVFQDVARYKRLCQEYAKEYGCEPSDLEIKHLLDIDRETLDKVKNASRIGQIRSLSEPIGEEGESMTLGEMVASDQDLEADAIQKRDYELMSEALQTAVNGLPEEQAQAIRWRYFEGLTLEEVGARFGCSGAKIKNMERKAIRKLGAPHTSRKYRSYWEEYRTPYPIWHIGIESFQRTGYSEVERAVLGWGD